MLRQVPPLLVLSASAYTPSADANGPPMAPEPERATLVHVDKSDRKLTLFRGKEVIASYPIRLGARPTGHKQREGDEKTPEGRYTLEYKNPNSRYHLSIRISYPNAEDRRRAAAAGYSPGGEIMIHGGNAWWRPFNWTDGCIAVTDQQMRVIWRLVDVGTPIQIDP